RGRFIYSEPQHKAPGKQRLLEPNIRLMGGGVRAGDRVSLLETCATDIDQRAVPRRSRPPEAQLRRAGQPLTRAERIDWLRKMVVQECTEAKHPRLGRLPGGSETTRRAPARFVSDLVLGRCNRAR